MTATTSVDPGGRTPTRQDFDEPNWWQKGLDAIEEFYPEWTTRSSSALRDPALTGPSGTSQFEGEAWEETLSRSPHSPTGTDTRDSPALSDEMDDGPVGMLPTAVRGSGLNYPERVKGGASFQDRATVRLSVTMKDESISKDAAVPHLDKKGAGMDNTQWNNSQHLPNTPETTSHHTARPFSNLSGEVSADLLDHNSSTGRCRFFVEDLAGPHDDPYATVEPLSSQTHVRPSTTGTAGSLIRPELEAGRIVLEVDNSSVARDAVASNALSLVVENTSVGTDSAVYSRTLKEQSPAPDTKSALQPDQSPFNGYIWPSADEMPSAEDGMQFDEAEELAKRSKPRGSQYSRATEARKDLLGYDVMRTERGAQSVRRSLDASDVMGATAQYPHAPLPPGPYRDDSKNPFFNPFSDSAFRGHPSNKSSSLGFRDVSTPQVIGRPSTQGTGKRSLYDEMEVEDSERQLSDAEEQDEDVKVGKPDFRQHLSSSPLMRRYPKMGPQAPSAAMGYGTPERRVPILSQYTDNWLDKSITLGKEMCTREQSENMAEADTKPSTPDITQSSGGHSAPPQPGTKRSYQSPSPQSPKLPQSAAVITRTESEASPDPLHGPPEKRHKGSGKTGTLNPRKGEGSAKPKSLAREDDGNGKKTTKPNKPAGTKARNEKGRRVTRSSVGNRAALNTQAKAGDNEDVEMTDAPADATAAPRFSPFKKPEIGTKERTSRRSSAITKMADEGDADNAPPRQTRRKSTSTVGTDVTSEATRPSTGAAADAGATTNSKATHNMDDREPNSAPPRRTTRKSTSTVETAAQRSAKTATRPSTGATTMRAGANTTTPSSATHHAIDDGETITVDNAAKPSPEPAVAAATKAQTRKRTTTTKAGGQSKKRVAPAKSKIRAPVARAETAKVKAKKAAAVVVRRAPAPVAKKTGTAGRKGTIMKGAAAAAATEETYGEEPAPAAAAPAAAVKKRGKGRKAKG
ncbi:hypothetical protein LTR66_013640 [Elasticomyces elasticus]|nr:hypothetical protein LTR66_013640 [Elasticomyces elasticus]